MNLNKLVVSAISFLLLTGFLSFSATQSPGDDRIISYTVDTKSQDLQFYWKDDSGKILGNIQNLKDFVEQKNLKLLFAMNGGMFKEDYSPLGLFIQQQKNLAPLNKSSGDGNFYLKPNGVFYVTTHHVAAEICKAEDFVNESKIDYATQSGPMLVIDGEIHPAFKQGSTNLNIRNGVGIMPDGKVVFAISKTEINFYDFASYFKSLGCKNALYLDGFVSKMYLPEKNWMQADGYLGVIIGVTAPAEK